MIILTEARTLQFIPLPASTKRRADFDLPVTVKTEPETSDQNVPVRPPGFSGPRLVNSAVNAIGEAWLRKKGHFPSYGGSSSSPQVMTLNPPYLLKHLVLFFLILSYALTHHVLAYVCTVLFINEKAVV